VSSASLGAAGSIPAPAPSSRRGLASRWFAALDSRAQPTAEPSVPSPLLALPLTVGAALALLLVKAPALRAFLGVALLVAAAAVGVRWLAARRAARDALRNGRDFRGRGIALDGERLAFLPGRVSVADVGRAAPSRVSRPSVPCEAGTITTMELLVLSAPFGVTLLASPRRDRMMALLSSASGTFYLGASFDAASRRAFAPLLDRCFTVVGDDAGMEAIGPDGEPLVLAPEELASLVDALVEQSPACLDRLVLTDARGAAIMLDNRQLTVGERAVDLNAPLEWKPIVFQEAFGHAIAVFQGTWIRQSGTEMTLVSLLPALGPAPSADLDAGTLDRAVLRDLRLMQAAPEAPPPNEQRVAIDRLFMLPVRSALDRAPRASQQQHPARA
jgi:hypothetical protein